MPKGYQWWEVIFILLFRFIRRDGGSKKCCCVIVHVGLAVVRDKAGEWVMVGLPPVACQVVVEDLLPVACRTSVEACRASAVASMNST